MACFSSAQLSKFSEKRITQETFDAAVQENITEFDMEPEEAVQSAVEEFTAQGVNLSNIIKSVTGGNISEHPAAKAVRELEAAVADADADTMAAAAGAVQAALKGVGSTGGSSEDGSKSAGNATAATAETLAVLHRAGAAAVLAKAVTACAAAEPALTAVLQALAALLSGTTRELQAGFLQAGGAAALAAALEGHAEEAALATAALQAAAATATKNEDGKAALMAVELGPSSLQVMKRHADQPEVLQAACALLCALTAADDDTLPASRAFPNARQLAKEGSALQLVAALKRHAALPSNTIVSLATALKQISANDEICQEVAGAGGVHLAVQILDAGLADVSLSRALCGLLRQLVSSDANKGAFVEAGGLELLCRLLGAHGGAPGVLEQALGLLTNLTLRNPEAAEKAKECGCLDAVLELMRAMLASVGVNGGGSNGGARNGKENRAGTAAQRQACMALRNLAVRSADVRAALLDKGAEGVLRQVKVTFPSCADVGSAALRDLGLDNYNS